MPKFETNPRSWLPVAVVASVLATACGGPPGTEPEGSCTPGELVDGERYELTWDCRGECLNPPLSYTSYEALEIIEAGGDFRLVYNDEIEVPAELVRSSTDGGETYTDCLMAMAEVAPSDFLIFCRTEDGLVGEMPYQRFTMHVQGCLVAGP